MKALAFALTLSLAAHLYAQVLAPELEPLAAKYRSDRAACDSQKSAALTRALQPYGSALDSAARTATSEGNLPAVAAIDKEREALKDGPMSSAFPEGLPKTLQAPRKACLDATTRVSADFAPRRKAIDADYLRVLLSLQTKAAGKPELAQQIATEKEKLLASADDEAALQIAKEIETLLTSKEWIHKGAYVYKFTKDGRYQFADRKGRFEIDGKKGFVAMNWDSGERESMLFNKTTRTFTHSAGGTFVPYKK